MSRNNSTNQLHSHAPVLSWLSISLFAVCALCSFSRAALPDLVIDKAQLANSVLLQRATFADGDCAVVEGCAPAGTLRLLKFDVGFKNIGNGDLVLGDPNARPDLFEFSPCHGHFHLHGAAAYELLTPSGQTITRARKQAFCFRDDIHFNPATGPAKFNCDFQGLSPGWEDMYPRDLDCQWLDVTGVPGGTYLLRVIVNPDQTFEESNYANNAATISINLPGRTPTPPAPTPAPPPPSQPPPKNPPPKVTKPNPWKNLANKAKAKKKHKKRHKPMPKPADDDHDEDHEKEHESGEKA